MTASSKYLSEDTISAISTSSGGAISIIRMSGPQAFSILSKTTRTDPTRRELESRKMHRAFLFDESQTVLDDALFVRFVGPNSYTGEDLVEFHTHGGGFIAHRLLETLNTLGSRQALPGEFSFRAVRNGKMTLFQAQAVVDLITASNETAVTLALEKLSGTQNEQLEKLAASLRKVSILSEIGIDFADQDVDEVSLPQLKKHTAQIIPLLQKIKNSYHRGIRIQTGTRVVFMGLPNAGKSSFFNALLGEDRSIVSEIAGTTRDIVREKMTLRGKTQTVTLRLEDTAGLRKTNNTIEKIGIEKTTAALREADLILSIVDSSQTLDSALDAIQKQWGALIDAKLDTAEITRLTGRTMGILTKCDVTNPEIIEELIPKLQKNGVQTWIQTSALTGDGIAQVVESIVDFCEKQTQREKGELMLTRPDHFTATKAALNHLDRALEAPEVDLFASDVRQALHALGSLIGETQPDDILGRIFSDFCIGK